jgi:hypothetical protein
MNLHDLLYGHLSALAVVFSPEGRQLERGTLLMKTIADLLNAHDLVPVARHDNPWAIRNPLDEARDLHRMVRSGSCSVGEIRELIAVPKLVEEALLAYAERYPKDGQQIYCVLHFREKVSREFERLIQSDPAPTEYEQTSVREQTGRDLLVN